MNIIITIDIPQFSARYILTCFPSFVHILSYDITCLLPNPPLSTPRHDAVPALYTHEYTAVHTRGQHPFSPLHISSLYIHMYCRYLRNRKHVPCFYRVIQTRVEVWENEKCCGNTSRRRVFPQFFRVLPNFHECLYNSIETRSTCFLFLLENTATRKRKTTR